MNKGEQAGRRAQVLLSWCVFAVWFMLFVLWPGFIWSGFYERTNSTTC